MNKTYHSTVLTTRKTLDPKFVGFSFFGHTGKSTFLSKNMVNFVPDAFPEITIGFWRKEVHIRALDGEFNSANPDDMVAARKFNNL